MPGSAKSWEVIANYEAHELVRRRYHLKHGWQPSAAHVQEIAAPFIQARQYYASAAIADRSVKPLLLYYGVTSLSRGLVLFMTRKLREACLARRHGLSIRDWQSILSATNPDVTKLQILTNTSGVFPELLRATSNRSLLRVNSSAVNLKISGGTVPPGTTFTFGEMLARLPDVSGQFSRWQIPRCVSADTIGGAGEVTFTVRRDAPYIDEEFVLGIVGHTHCDLVNADPSKVVVCTKRGEVAGMLTDQVLDTPLEIGNLFLAAPYSSGASLSKCAEIFALSYVLSMLVRYHPAFWMALIHQRIDDAALPTVLATIDSIERLFPRIVVDFLEE